MSISINTASIYSNFSNLRNLSREIEESALRISTGSQMNHARDNVGGLHSSITLRAGASAALRYAKNASEGLATLSTADIALDEVSDLVNRFRELAIEASNTATTATRRTAIQAEATAVTNQITQLSADTVHNGTKLLDGTFTTKTYQIGPSTTSNVSVSLTSSSAANLGAYMLTGSTRAATSAATSATANDTSASEDVTIAGTTIEAAANDSAKAMATKINSVSSTTGVTAIAETYALLETSDVSATTYTIKINDTSTASFSISASDVSGAVTAINAISTNTGVSASATSDFKVLLHDADGDDLTVENADSDTGLSVQAVQIDGTTTQGSAVSLGASGASDATRVIGTIRLSADSSFSVTQSGTASQGYLSTASSAIAPLSTASLATSIDAAKAITIADSALNQVATLRGTIGAAESRLTFSESANERTYQNKVTSLSSLSDADIAVEAARLAKAQMLQKVSLAVQAQARSADELIIALLKGTAA